MKDLIQVDIDTALALYLKGYTHIPVLQRDGYSTDWPSMQPLYLDDVLNNLMVFASDSKRAELLNVSKTAVAKTKESIALEFGGRRNLVSDDEDDWEDDDPDWTETEPSKPEPIETIPDDDAVPEHERIQYAPPRVLTVEEVTKITEKTEPEPKTDKPPKWNILRVNKLSNEGWSNKQIADEYGVTEQVVKERLTHYRMKS